MKENFIKDLRMDLENYYITMENVLRENLLEISKYFFFIFINYNYIKEGKGEYMWEGERKFEGYWNSD